MEDNFLGNVLDGLQRKMEAQDDINRDVQKALNSLDKKFIEIVCPYSEKAVIDIIKQEAELSKEKTWKKLAKYIGFVTAVATMVVAILKALEAMGINFIK